MTITATRPGAPRHQPADHHGHHSRRQPRVPVDVYRCDDRYLLLCDLPGVDTGTLDVRVAGTEVTLRAYRSAPALTDAEHVSAERPLGGIHRRITLDQPADGHITATYTDGVLTLTIPTTGTATGMTSGGRPTSSTT
jgi:HSP20 family protein